MEIARTYNVSFATFRGSGMRDSMHLHRIDPDRNMARFYSMSVQPNLFCRCDPTPGATPTPRAPAGSLRPLRLQAGGRSDHGSISSELSKGYEAV